jgi:hypothetical protein
MIQLAAVHGKISAFWAFLGRIDKRRKMSRRARFRRGRIARSHGEKLDFPAFSPRAIPRQVI